jgi:hypothetical protein
VLLYEMLTGRHPFGSSGLPSTIAKTLAAYPDKPDIDAELWSIISRTLEKNPDDRFPSTKDLVAVLSGDFPGKDPFPGKDLHPGKDQPPGKHQPPGTRPVPSGSATINWGSTHHLIVALAYWFMAWPAWHVHRWTGRYGVLTFLGTIAIVVVGANVRLHLWFTARTYPGELPSQIANTRRLVRAADIAFSVMMIGIGLVIADAHPGWSALFVSFGLGAAMAFLIIEPATARAAFKSTIRDQRSEI